MLTLWLGIGTKPTGIVVFWLTWFCQHKQKNGKRWCVLWFRAFHRALLLGSCLDCDRSNLTWTSAHFFPHICADSPSFLLTNDMQNDGAHLNWFHPTFQRKCPVFLLVITSVLLRAYKSHGFSQCLIWPTTVHASVALITPSCKHRFKHSNSLCLMQQQVRLD